MTTVERWATGSGIRVRYLDNAPAEPHGLPILFSPGVVDIAEDYLEVLDAMAPRRVLVVEVRGRGKSEAPADGYAVADHVRDLQAVVDAEGLERFHVMTFSRGSSWAMDLVLGNPEPVASLSIGDYKAFELGMPESWVDSQWATRWRGTQMTERTHRHVLAGIVAGSKNRQLWDDLGALDVPLLVARGTEPGSIIDDATEAQWRAARPDAEIVRIEGSGHDLFRRERMAYPSAVLEFIDRRGLDVPAGARTRSA